MVKLVQNLCSSGETCVLIWRFFFRIVLVAGEEGWRWMCRGVMEWKGGVAQGELVEMLAQDWSKKKNDHSSR